MVMLAISIDPERRAPRTTVSLPIALMPRKMSRRLPAIVIYSTGY